MKKYHTFSKARPAPSTLKKMYLLKQSQSVFTKPIIISKNIISSKSNFSTTKDKKDKKNKSIKI
jgi:hypothetical protein